MAFSDYQYMQRGSGAVFLFIYFVYSLWRSNRFETLSLHRLRHLEFRSIVGLMMFAYFAVELFYCFSRVRITYAEGYIVNPTDGRIYTKPQANWTRGDQATIEYTDYIGDISLSLEASILFLLQCFWDSLSQSITKQTFMNSIEWKVYLFFAFASPLMYPVIQKSFDFSPIAAELAPLLTFVAQLYIVGGLGILSHVRFNRLIASSMTTQRQLKNNIAVLKLNYFRWMNAALTIFLFLAATIGLALCIDTFSPSSTKLRNDALACFGTIAFNFALFFVISIFFPSRAYSIEMPDETSVQMKLVKSTTQSQSSSNTPTKPFTGIIKSLTVEIKDESQEDDKSLRKGDDQHPTGI